MNDSVGSLCCCEYIDLNQERNHILGCCCNCVDLDVAFESLITGQDIEPQTRSGLMSTMQDRMRIPWRGGAKQIAIDAILPLIMLPTMFLMAAIGRLWTIFSFTTVIIFLLVIFKFLIRTIPRTKFFFIWTITSGTILYCVFEFIVIPFLQILVEENVILSALIFGFVLCVYIMKNRASQLSKLDETDAAVFGRNCRLFNCSLCQITVPDKDHHCVWFDCCIGRHNQCVFILALLFSSSALIYSSNLTLTSVCHPFVLYKTILLPDDCSEVYNQYELGIAFVAALYSCIVGIFVFVLLMQQLLLVSIGMTVREWNELPFLHKCCLGLLVDRPNNRGFATNWSRLTCGPRNQYNLLNQM